MANRFFQQFRYSLEKQVVDLYAHVSFGSSEEALVDFSRSKGIKSMTRTGTGAYDIVLQDSYQRLLVANVIFKDLAPTRQMFLVSDASNVLPAPTISVQFRDASDNTADPGIGSQIWLQLTLSNSTAF